MSTPNPTTNSDSATRGLKAVFAWRRLRFTLFASLIIGLPLSISFVWGIPRAIILGLVTMIVFGIIEQWPRHLPKWLARWALQVLCVGVAMPITTYLIYRYSTPTGAPPFWLDPNRLRGFASLTFISMLLAPWAALAALVRQKDALARHQKLSFELERSKLERNALDSRLRLLQAQVEPHFLFNTLANVRELVDSGSPQASQVLGSLIAYLRAAVPRLQDPATTMRQELTLVRAYLELMHMRMPDRLQFTLDIDDSTLDLTCPPTTLLTLVENAVRHGIDPSENGGQIIISVHQRGTRCVVKVADTGVGIQSTGIAKNAQAGTGTGLTTLTERLQLIFNGDAQLRLTELDPHGVSVELDFPAVRGTQ